MSPKMWSRLYPRAWRQEFGAEFEALLEQMNVGPREAFDIVRAAVAIRMTSTSQRLPYLLAWLMIAWLNIVAKEVQWPAGMLLLSAGAATSGHPRRWFRITLLFASAIPVSSLYFYQIPGIHHEPLYKTAVALVPAFVGSCLGLAVSSLRPRSDGGTPA